MTDRLKGVLVTFDRDIREDDAEHILNAIRMVRGVQDVSPLVADHVDHLARVRIDAEWRERILAMVRQAPWNGNG